METEKREKERSGKEKEIAVMSNEATGVWVYESDGSDLLMEITLRMRSRLVLLGAGVGKKRCQCGER